MKFSIQGSEIDLTEILYVGKEVVVACINEDLGLFLRDDGESDLSTALRSTGLKFTDALGEYQGVIYNKLEEHNGKASESDQKSFLRRRCNSKDLQSSIHRTLETPRSSTDYPRIKERIK